MGDNMKSLDSQRTWIYCLLFVVLSLIIAEIIMLIDWSLVVAVLLVVCGVWFFGFKDIGEDNTNHSELHYLDFLNSKVELYKHFNFNGKKYRDLSLIEQLKSLEPTEFEDVVAEYFKKEGFDVTQTKRTHDGGKDIILKRNEQIYYVECKKYSDDKIGRELIQKLVGACHPYNAQPVFITTSDFNRFAVDEARLSNVILVNGERLVELMKKQILGVEVNLSQSTSK